MDLGAIPKRKGLACGEMVEACLLENLEDTHTSGKVETTVIEDLPDEVLEHILSLLSPYSDLESCALTSTRWAACCRRVKSQHRQHFRQHLGKAKLVWSHLSQEGGAATISKRYSHCAVYCPKRSSMFVFGGCTSTSSTFNDLWELNLSQRTWHRAISVGAYPSPKACASLVLDDDQLILFGGWTHPSLYPLHQSWKLFSELHIYNVSENRWELIDGGDQPPAMAGHSATVHRGSMVVFGGLHKQRSIGHYTSSNDVWTFHLATKTWQLCPVLGNPPLARYGQSQIFLSPDHLLVIGGCGGPNNEYTDIWLLNMEAQPWKWVQMEVRGSENRAKDIWSHPACRVGDKVVILGKARKEEAGPIGEASKKVTTPQARRGVIRGQGATRRTSAPAPHHASASEHQQQRRRQDISSSDSDLELAVEPMVGGRPSPSYRTSVSLTLGSSSPLDNPPGPSRLAAGPSTSSPPSALPPSNPASAPNALIPVKVTPAHAKAFGPSANTGTMDPSLSRTQDQQPGPASPPGAAPGTPGNPEMGRQLAVGTKNRQKMLENRQRQLATLAKMEQKIKMSSSSSSRQPDTSSAPTSCPHHRLTLHLLDISQAVDGHWVEWMLLPHTSLPNAPQESILYSLVLGRTELIMFGGLQKDVRQGSSRPQPSAETVSNSLHFLNLPPTSIS